MSTTAVEARAHANLVEFVRFIGKLDGHAELVDEPGILAILGAIDFPSARVAIPQGTTLAPAAFADRACDFLLSRGKTACVYVRADDRALHDELTARGFAEYSTSPEMVCEQRLEDRPAPAGVVVRLAKRPTTCTHVRRDRRARVPPPPVPGADHPRCRRQSRGDARRGRPEIALADVDGRPVARCLLDPRQSRAQRVRGLGRVPRRLAR
jgi:hypothetical protein